jgi:hypothetical protein
MAYHNLLPHLAESMRSFVKEFSFYTTLPGTIDDLVLMSLFGSTSFSSAAVIFSVVHASGRAHSMVGGWVWMWCV